MLSKDLIYFPSSITKAEYFYIVHLNKTIMEYILEKINQFLRGSLLKLRDAAQGYCPTVILCIYANSSLHLTF